MAEKIEFFDEKTECDLEELLSSEADLLGRGTFGITYKADNENGQTFVVKRLKNFDTLPQQAFKEKIQELSKICDHHQNLLPLRAYYFLRDDKLLIYDCMPLGNLASILHEYGEEEKALLTWEIRTNIAYGVALGLEHLHAQGSNVCHGNIRSSNVLLTDYFDARLSEVGIFNLFRRISNIELITGYRSPEVINAHEVSQKSDVYSYGVLLLELLTGNDPLGAVDTYKGVNLADYVRLLFREKAIVDIFDTMLQENFDNFGTEMVECLELAICCTFKNPNKRPSMAAVTNQIKETCRFKHRW